MSDCCQHEHKESPEPEERNCCGSKTRIDWLLWGSLLVVALAYAIHFFRLESFLGWTPLMEFSHGAHELMTRMWWGVVAGIVAVGLMHQVPREAVMKVMGRSGSVSGIFRAVLGGVALDLCNHGILLVGMKLYERGATLGQVFAFLIASPWNSFSLTLILVALVGLPMTLLFILLSMLIALVTGILVEKVIHPPKRETVEASEDTLSWGEVWQRTRASFPNKSRLVPVVLRDGLSGSKMVLRWVFFGVVLASGIRALFDPQSFQEWFGPSVSGLFLTLAGATIIEVCSEGSTPIGADLVNRAGAPGNGFVFLMAGAATDYTEIMSLKETTGLWSKALLLPAVTVPQVLVVGYLVNLFG
ncbi:MAG TPA: permease [Opitutales bacterium]|nr:permease [Opitutales bacterium]